ncbi:polyamine transporter 3 [Dothidotthia symphoricarpi CBS 119687]|uniref:Polyamine transporter 3 n=1 Tax=Dothidotthia symphoricarpi CBS 119687 TaxID=1392245 RepID=A0A6A6AU24_9PLEO|nr:polyamine transporter 3 [Dothidotthia symphoricarpi CBS 119687]KAF2134688.1 polyamine transporter 3 [Dothidotthia symphoricarpi CBS 119687]
MSGNQSITPKKGNHDELPKEKTYVTVEEKDVTAEEDRSSETYTDSPDPSNPLTWSFRRRLSLAAIISLLVALPPISSTMLAPANTLLRTDFNITSSTKLQLVFSIYNLGYGIGPLVLAPLSEMYGRLLVIHSCTAAFLVFNTAAGFARSGLQLGAFRFLSACVGSTIMSVGSGVLGDSFAQHEFGLAGAVYGLMPLLGPVIGPVAGGFAVEYGSWRWMCWTLSLVGVVLQCVALVFLRETHRPTILRREKATPALKSGKDIPCDEQNTNEPWSCKAIRPLKLLATQPLIQFLGLYLAFLTGVCYIIEYTFPTLWTERYNQTTANGGLNYIAIGIGFVVGALTCSYLNDRVYKALTARNGGTGKPEFRIPVMLLGALLAPAGLFWYGWTAQAGAHWILPDIGIAIYAKGFVIGIVNTHMYVVDYYGSYAASAVAAVSFAQALFGFLLPLFGPALYTSLGYGWGNSIMGFIAICIGWPLPALLWKYGEVLQSNSPYSARRQPCSADKNAHV